MTTTTPPFVPGLPLLGNSLAFRRSAVDLLRQGYERYGSIFGIRLMSKPVAVLIHPDHSQTFYLETDKSLRIDIPYQFLKPMFGEIAFVAGPEVYKKQRHILHAPFKREKMLGYTRIMQYEVEAWLDSLGEGGKMDLVPAIMRLTQFVAAHTLLGRAFRYEMDETFWSLYADLAQGIDFLLPPDLPLPKFRRRDRAKRAMMEMLAPIMADRRANPEKHEDFLQEFVEARYKDGQPLSDEDVTNMVIGLVFAGHETTSAHAAWAIVHLLQHPDYLAQLQAEVDAILQPGQEIDEATLRELPHVLWALKETERYLPVTSMLMRYVEKPVEVGGYTIPAGWLAMVSPAVAHRLPDLFDDPDRYDPLRFAPGREEDKKHRFALTGFGGGVHKCAGMNFAYTEMTVIVALLFKRFNLELLTREPREGQGINRRPLEARVRLSPR